MLGVVDMPVIPKPRRQRQNLRAQGRSGLPSVLSIDSESTSENPEEKKKLNYFILIKHENLKESIASYIAEMSFVPQFRSSYNGVIRYFPGEKHSGKFSLLRNKPPCLQHYLSYHEITA